MADAFSERRDYQQGGDSYIGVANNERRIVLIGKTGVGKSATGNTILGEKKAFQSKVSVQSVTKACHNKTAMRFGRKVLIVDTPGLFDTKISNKETGEEIAKCIGITAPGPHAFIIVVQIGRFTEEERKTVEEFADRFGEGLFKYAIVLFTRKEDLEDEERTLEEYIKDVDGSLKDILRKSGNRCIAINNRADLRAKDEDVKRLLDMIEQILVDNKGSFYTNEMYEAAEQITQERIQRVLKEEEDRKKKELEAISNQIASQFQSQIDQMHAENKRAAEQLEKERKQRVMDGTLREYEKELERKLRETEERERRLREEERQEIERERRKMLDFMREKEREERDGTRRVYEEKGLLSHGWDSVCSLGKAVASPFKQLFK